ncbi:hypothetical protein RHGRI_011113 [Rhododendron griersonianum]|uniref:Uncharacterized protein n=1 Tax=Rhododendron griersonianum TaxID=479676 RepID=A0AAV6KKU1_9ERIC|nr:hypothetical protein RHGRI_011113 [Rhododendron griersonianum]
METTRPPLQNSIHRTPQPSPSPFPSLSLSDNLTPTKKNKTKLRPGVCIRFDSNADSQDSPPQWSHSHRRRRRRDSEGSDDGRRRKISPLKKILDDGVAKYLAKKVQKRSKCLVDEVSVDKRQNRGNDSAVLAVHLMVESALAQIMPFY